MLPIKETNDFYHLSAFLLMITKTPVGVKELINEFLSGGFKTITCCVNDAYLGEDRVGEEITKEFIKILPANIDPCGENGEYHTFCFAGPIFKTPINFTAGEKVYKPLESNPAQCGTDFDSDKPLKKGFWFCDLIAG